MISADVRPGDILRNHIDDNVSEMFVVIRHIDRVEDEQTVILFSIEKNYMSRRYINSANCHYWEIL